MKQLFTKVQIQWMYKWAIIATIRPFNNKKPYHIVSYQSHRHEMWIQKTNGLIYNKPKTNQTDMNLPFSVVDSVDSESSTFVCFILSHGTINNKIITHDNIELDLNDITSLTDVSALKGKPKIFFIQVIWFEYVLDIFWQKINWYIVYTGFHQEVQIQEKINVISSNYRINHPMIFKNSQKGH